MTLEQYIAELQAEMSAYKSDIDPVSIAKWVVWALEPFGMNISTLQETVVGVSDGQADLPLNFYSLYLAFKCDPHGYHMVKGESKDLQLATSWVERSECGVKWDSCDPCCKEEFDKIIVEKKYIETCEVECYYKNPVLLRLGKSMVRNKCHAECRNRMVRDCPHEISIMGTTLYANFDGKIYMQYYGKPVDTEGGLVIPDSPQGYLAQYVDAFVKRKFFEGQMTNMDLPQAPNLFQTYLGLERQLKSAANTDIKFSRMTPRSFRRLARVNRMDMLRYSVNLL